MKKRTRALYPYFYLRGALGMECLPTVKGQRNAQTMLHVEEVSGDIIES